MKEKHKQGKRRGKGENIIINNRCWVNVRDKAFSLAGS